MKGEVLDEAALWMTDRDTVATALDDLDAGRHFDLGGEAVTLRDDVPFGHKFALERVEAGEPIYKYGEIIGRAMEAIRPGEWVHTHNCESTRGRGDVPAGAEGGA